MEEKTYYSVMKKEELAIPWTNDSDKILKFLKNDKDAMLLSMTGKENEKTKEWVNHGMIETYEQETLDQLINSHSEKNKYLDNAFSIMDDLDSRGNPEQSPYTSALYLSAALTEKMKVPDKITWILGIAVAYGAGFSGKIDPSMFKIISWNDDDNAFIDKLLQTPIEPPKWNRNKVSLIFTPRGNMYYYEAAEAFQDIMELMKLNSGGFQIDRLQNKHSLELIHMAYELSKFYPNHH